jgi:hypothetical protein
MNEALLSMFNLFATMLLTIATMQKIDAEYMKNIISSPSVLLKDHQSLLESYQQRQVPHHQERLQTRLAMVHQN